MKKLLLVILFTGIHMAHCAEFECTWNEYKGPLYSMVPGQKPHITGQAWPLMHRTINADDEQQALEQCQQEVLPPDGYFKALSIDQLKSLWLQANTKNWAAASTKNNKAQKTTDVNEWHCTVEGSHAAPLKIVAATEQEAHAKCALMNAGHPLVASNQKKIEVKKLTK